jgi:hypothetical protein
MTDRTEIGQHPQERREQPVKRPWHAPRFITTDIASTDTQGNGGTDGGTMGSPS